jgi:hypothetical protein
VKKPPAQVWDAAADPAAAKRVYARLERCLGRGEPFHGEAYALTVLLSQHAGYIVDQVRADPRAAADFPSEGELVEASRVVLMQLGEQHGATEAYQILAAALFGLAMVVQRKVRGDQPDDETIN